MGKKKDPYAKGFEGYLDRYKANDKLAEQYGVDKSQYQTRHGQLRPGVNPLGKKSFDEYEKAISSAVANDYDTRESLKYAKDAGNKRAEKIGDIDNIESAYKASTFMRKTHNKKMGNGGGDYDGTKASHQGGVSNYWFNKSRDQFGSGFATPGDLKAMSVENQQASAQKQEPYKESAELSQAKERVQNWQGSQFGSASSPYGQR